MSDELICTCDEVTKAMGGTLIDCPLHGHSYVLMLIKLITALEAERDKLKEKITTYESRPWPGCKILSLGDKCDCHLCEAEKMIERLKAENKSKPPLKWECAGCENRDGQIATLQAELARERERLGLQIEDLIKGRDERYEKLKAELARQWAGPIPKPEEE